MKYQAVIFDWDGTLVDSTGKIVESMQLASSEAGLTALHNQDIKQIIGLGLPEAIRQLWPAIEEDVVVEMRGLYNKHYMSEHHPRLRFYGGADELLQGLQSKGVELAVATGKSRAGLDRAFKDLKIGHMFSDSRCADETKSKPHPLMLEELSESLGVSFDEMIMVGDTTFDLNMAKAIGVDSVGITHGAHSYDQLLGCEPVHMVRNLSELHNWLTEA